MADPRFIVVGTAGHIDHGKTALVQALTGKNTDRLKEEAERGISIDIDFAPLRFDDGTLIGMVDVPGHERFVRNMVAGAAGIDAALLVVDVNEGFKPQTYEHIAILDLLGVKRGVVALTKSDLAEPEWVEVAVEIVRETMSTTPFANWPFVVTSVKTGQGVEQLKASLHELAVSTPMRDVRGAFRHPVDKVFSIPGIGTVVSGTVWRGQVEIGQTLDLLPHRQPVRVRSIQVHGKPVHTAFAGQRAALNIVGADHTQIRRGSVLAASHTLTETKLIDCEIRLVDKGDVVLRHRDRVHVHLSTAEVVGRVLLLDADEVGPGQSAFAQLLLERPLVCESLDYFVIRSFSPVATVGGGRVLDVAPTRLHRRKRAGIIALLSARNSQSPQQRLTAVARDGRGITVQRVMAELGLTESEAIDLLDEGVNQGRLAKLPTAWYPLATIENTLSALNQALWSLHHKRRFASTIPRQLVVSSVPHLLASARDLDWLFDEGARRGLWQSKHAEIWAVGWKIELQPAEQALADQMLTALQQAGLSGVTAQSLCGQFPKRDRVAKSLLGYLSEAEQVVDIGADTLLHHRVVQQALKTIQTMYDKAGPFSVASVRDALETSRKQAVALLEYFDRVGLTKREGDVRHISR